MRKSGGKPNFKNKGKGKSFQKKGNGKNKTFDKKDYRFHPHGIGREQQTCTFDTARDHCIQHIQSTYDYGTDMATALRNLKEFDFEALRPTREQVQLEAMEGASEQELKTIEDNRRFLQESADMTYKDEYARFSKRKAKYSENQGKAYAYIFGKCVKELQTRVEEHKDFEATIRNDPIALLKHLSEAMNVPVKETYPLATATEVLLQLLQTRQKDKEDVLDYIKRFKQSWRIMKSHMGENFLHDFIENTAEYKELDPTSSEVGSTSAVAPSTQSQIDMKKKAMDKWQAYLLIRNLDQKQYGKITSSLTSQYVLNNDQYPKDIGSAIMVINTRKRELEVLKRLKDKREKNKNNNKKSGNNNNDEGKVETNFAQDNSTRFCYVCGDPNHLSTDCKKKESTAKKDWYINKLKQSHAQQSGKAESADKAKTEDDGASTNTNPQGPTTSWCGTHVHFQADEQPTDLDRAKAILKQDPDELILDTGSETRRVRLMSK